MMAVAVIAQADMAEWERDSFISGVRIPAWNADAHLEILILILFAPQMAKFDLHDLDKDGRMTQQEFNKMGRSHYDSLSKYHTVRPEESRRI